MINDDKRIPLEMSMQNIDVEVSRLTDLLQLMEEADKIYLKSLALRLGELSAQLNKPTRYQASYF